MKIPKWKQHASKGLRMPVHLTGACVGNAIHCPLHISLILSIAQDQIVLPACQSPVDQVQSVSSVSSGQLFEGRGLGQC